MRETTLATAAAPGAPARPASGIVDVLLPIAVLIITLIVMLAILNFVRARARRGAALNASPGSFLESLRQLHREGKMTTEEFEAARARLHAGLKGSSASWRGAPDTARARPVAPTPPAARAAPAAPPSGGPNAHVPRARALTPMPPADGFDQPARGARPTVISPDSPAPPAPPTRPAPAATPAPPPPPGQGPRSGPA